MNRQYLRLMGHGSLCTTTLKGSKMTLKCAECDKILDGTCIVRVYKGIADLYFCGKKCKKDWIRLNE